VGSAYAGHDFVRPLEVVLFVLVGLTAYIFLFHRSERELPDIRFNTITFCVSTAVMVAYWFIYTRYVNDPDQAEWFTSKELFGIFLFWWPAMVVSWGGWILESFTWTSTFIEYLKRLGMGLLAVVAGIGIYPFLYGQVADLQPFHRLRAEIENRHLQTNENLQSYDWENNGIDPVTPGTVTIQLHFSGDIRRYPHRGKKRVHTFLKGSRRLIRRRDTNRIEVRAYVAGDQFLAFTLTDQNYVKQLNEPLPFRNEVLRNGETLTGRRFLDLFREFVDHDISGTFRENSTPFKVGVKDRQLSIDYQFDSVRPRDGEWLWGFFRKAPSILASVFEHYPTTKSVYLNVPTVEGTIERDSLSQHNLKKQIHHLIDAYQEPSKGTQGEVPVLFLDDSEPSESIEQPLDSYQHKGRIANRTSSHYLVVTRDTALFQRKFLFDRHYLGVGWLFVTNTDSAGRIQFIYFDDDHPERTMGPRWLEPGEELRNHGMLIAHRGMVKQSIENKD